MLQGAFGSLRAFCWNERTFSLREGPVGGGDHSAACGVRGCPCPLVHSALAAEPSHLLNAMAAKDIQSAAAFVCLAVAAAKQPIVEFFHTSGLSYWE